MGRVFNNVLSGQQNNISFLLGLCPKMENEWNKWKNHFCEMKGDVGMSCHKKERNKKILHQDTKSFITPSLHLCFFEDHNIFHIDILDVKLFCQVHL